MRYIQYRGKSAVTGEWVYGYLVPMEDIISGYAITGNHARLPLCNAIGSYVFCEVLNDTIGEYIGIKDSNDKMIFEDDIVLHGNEHYQIKYLEKYARFAGVRPGVMFAVFDFKSCTVVGNIFDNPELLQRSVRDANRPDGC